jgi:hypothetical protein
MSESMATAAEQPSLPVKLQDGERVLELCRRHWVYLWPSVALQALFGLIPLVIGAVVIDKAGISGAAAQIIWAVLAIHLVFRGLKAFLTWYRYHNDIWVISNQRLIDSYKRHPFSLEISTADLVNVQDISVERNGVLRTVLDYGDIVCQTAAEMQGFRLAGIPDPRTIQALIDRERDRERMRIR